MSISTQVLAQTVAELTAPGKGILTADESTGTIKKRLKSVNVAGTASARMAGDAGRFIGAQRDYFGTHTYQRVDRPEADPIHNDWERLLAATSGTEPQR